VRVKSAGAAVALLLMACGTSGGSVHRASGARHLTSSPRPTASPSAPGLLALAESQSPQTASSQQHDALALVSPTGAVQAEVGFEPRAIPLDAGANPALASDVAVSPSGLYYMDGAGVIRRLASDGVVTTTSAFQISSSRQEVSFAVSPDGGTVLAAVLTLPALPSSPPSPAPASAPRSSFASQPYVLEVAASVNGSSPVVLHRWASLEAPGSALGFDMIRLVGWDQDGPVALVGGSATLGASSFAGQTLQGGHLANLDPRAGVPTSTVLGGCGVTGASQPWSVSDLGLIVCAGTQTVSVRDSAGGTLFQATYPRPQGYGGWFQLSPDGSALAMAGEVVESSGQTIRLPQNLHPEGWVDDQTLVVGLGPGPSSRCHGEQELATVELTLPGRANDLGLCGDFVGTVT